MSDTELSVCKKLEMAAGTLLTVSARSEFNLRPICKLLKEAHDHIKAIEAENALLKRIHQNKKVLDYLKERSPDNLNGESDG